MILEDLEKHSDENAPNNGLRSISEGKVYFGHPLQISRELLKYSVETVCCKEHGAMLCMARWKDGTMWRCPTCNEGAFKVEVNND
jgi:hypothetical protein